jgi:mannose-1-phosphate guanylyltransferase
LKLDPDAVMLVMPADHAISPNSDFHASVERAVSLVKSDPEALVLFGVRPSSPATGYGYMERGEALAKLPGAYRVERFREKPDRQTAEQYIAAGRFYWNCGIFVWRAQTLLNALREFEPDMHAHLMVCAMRLATEYTATLQREFPLMKSISIDFAVLEKSTHVHVVEASFEWDDVGSWLALERLLGIDDDGNTIDALHCGIETRGCIVRGPSGHLIATAGLEDCIIVHTPDATLVARKDDENAIRRLVERLKELGHDQFL